MTSAEKFGVELEIITLTKGLTSAVMPMGAAGVKDEIYESMVSNADASIELFHGYTYSGYSLACVATLDAYAEDDISKHSANLTDYMAGIDLASRDGVPDARAYDVMKAMWDKGVMVRISGNSLAFSPPLIISKVEID